jgi:hypothetical protein
MNQHKKALFLFIVLFLFSCYSITAFATVITPEQVQQIIEQQEAASKSANASGTSSLKNSGSGLSSKKTVSSVSSYPSEGSGNTSGELSSEDASALSSEEQSSEIVLPSVGSVPENNPLSSVIVDSAANQKTKWIGIISWACIILGVIVVLIVVFSNRRPPSGGSGRKRYRRPSRTHKKRLLNDKYYRNMKF